MTKPKPFAAARMFVIAFLVILSAFFLQACNDSGDKPEETETPAATSSDTIVPPPDTTNVSDTLSSDTTKGGQPAPPR